MAINDQLRIRINQKYVSIAQTSRGDSARSIVESHPSIKAAAGKLWLHNMNYRQTSTVIMDLTCWYLWFEDLHGEAGAKDTLYRYLDCGSVKTTFCVWVFGIQPQKIYDLNSIFLVPVDQMPDSRERDEYRALIRDHKSPVSYAAFTKVIELPRVIDNKDEKNTIARFAKTHDLLSEVAALVNGLKDLSCLPDWLCTYQDANIPFGPWNLSGRSRVCVDVLGNHSRVFSDDDAQVLQKLIESYEPLDVVKKQWLQVVLDRIRKSKRQQVIESKILDLGIAAEMLLLEELGERDPIAFPFRFRGSWLLGRDFQGRKHFHETLKKFYSYRCMVAHNGVFKNELDAKAARKKLPEFYSIVEQILQLAISPTYPRKSDDWLALILGKEDKCGSDSHQES
jgi:hypothetical protein